MASSLRRIIRKCDRWKEIIKIKRIIGRIMREAVYGNMSAHTWM